MRLMCLSLTVRWITYVHVFGSVCVCVCVQNNVAGALCDECKAGFFHLSEANPEGCLRCFCMGVTKQCASSTWNRDQAGCQATNGKRRGEYFWYQGLSQCLCSRAVSADPFRCWTVRSSVQTAIVPGCSIHICISARISFRQSFVSLRCSEGWTGSSSPSLTAPTVKLSLKASPRRAPLKLCTAPSPVSPSTSTTGSCLRASEEIRSGGKQQSREQTKGEERKNTPWSVSRARFLCPLCPTQSCLNMLSSEKAALIHTGSLLWTHSQHGCLVTSPTVSYGVKCLSTIHSFPFFATRWRPMVEICNTRCALNHFSAHMLSTVSQMWFSRATASSWNTSLRPSPPHESHKPSLWPSERCVSLFTKESHSAYSEPDLMFSILHLSLACSLHGAAPTGSRALVSTCWWLWLTLPSSWSGPPTQTKWLRAGTVTARLIHIPFNCPKSISVNCKYNVCWSLCVFLCLLVSQISRWTLRFLSPPVTNVLWRWKSAPALRDTEDLLVRYACRIQRSS